MSDWFHLAGEAIVVTTLPNFVVLVFLVFLKQAVKIHESLVPICGDIQ